MFFFYIRFYFENGLKVLNEWLLNDLEKKEKEISKDKKIMEVFAQIRALLRVISLSHSFASLFH